MDSYFQARLTNFTTSTVYDIMKPTGVNYIGFMCWIGM